MNPRSMAGLEENTPIGGAEEGDAPDATPRTNGSITWFRFGHPSNTNECFSVAVVGYTKVFY